MIWCLLGVKLVSLLLCIPLVLLQTADDNVSVSALTWKPTIVPSKNITSGRVLRA